MSSWSMRYPASEFLLLLQVGSGIGGESIFMKAGKHREGLGWAPTRRFWKRGSAGREGIPPVGSTPSMVENPPVGAGPAGESRSPIRVPAVRVEGQTGLAAVSDAASGADPALPAGPPVLAGPSLRSYSPFERGPGSELVFGHGRDGSVKVSGSFPQHTHRPEGRKETRVPPEGSS